MMRIEDDGAAEGGFAGDFAQDKVFADESVDGMVEAELGLGIGSRKDGATFFGH